MPVIFTKPPSGIAPIPYSVSPRLNLTDRRREEEEEALDAHPDGLGGDEVAASWRMIEQREADEGEEPAHASAQPAERHVVGAASRASASTSKRSCEKWPIGLRPASPRARARSPRGCRVNGMLAVEEGVRRRPRWRRSARRARCRRPRPASRARRRQANASRSGASNVSEPTSARSSALDRHVGARRDSAARRRSAPACRGSRGARAWRRR